MNELCLAVRVLSKCAILAFVLAQSARANDAFSASGVDYVAYPGEEDCTLSVTVSGGSGNFSYEWSDSNEDSSTLTLDAPDSGEVQKTCTVTDQDTNESKQATPKLTVFSVKQVTADKTAILKDGTETITLTAELDPSAPENTPSGGLLQWQRKVGSGGWQDYTAETEEEIELQAGDSQAPNYYQYQVRAKGTDASFTALAGECFVLSLDTIEEPGPNDKLAIGTKAGSTIRGPYVYFTTDPPLAQQSQYGVQCSAEFRLDGTTHKTDSNAFEDHGYIVMESMPDDNAQWGPNNYVTIFIKRNTAILHQEDVTINLFFDKHAKTNPDADPPPNWFYYWKKGDVIEDIDQFSYREEPGKCGTTIGDTVYLCTCGADNNSYNYTLHNWYYHAYISTGPDGICNTRRFDTTDVQEIPVGHGRANVVCIRPGANGVLDSSNKGDDRIYGNQIDTGNDGICQTERAGDDTWANGFYEAGMGLPNQTCISAGADGFLTSADDANRDSRLEGGDEWILDYSYNVNLNQNTRGIYTCATTMAHELEHLELSQNHTPDADGDGLRNGLEGVAPYHFCSTRSDTYWISNINGWGDYFTYGDQEILARKHGIDNPKTVYDNMDWSEDGEQW